MIKLCFSLKCACTRKRQQDVEFTDMTPLELRYVASGKTQEVVRLQTANKSTTCIRDKLVLYSTQIVKLFIFSPSVLKYRSFRE